ncbi:MAG: hypothetical protein FJW31_14930 [Acidobacteria bacterium]|nr:hypothetical protein [Acidobacteriota bacterium]
MGYALEFHALDWDRLNRVLGCRDERVFNEVVKRQRAAIQTGICPVEPSWEDSLRTLIMDGNKAKAPVVSSKEALALVAVVRWINTCLGEIMHTTRGGGKFRSMFEPGFARQFQATTDWRYLLNRPLVALEHQGYPSWGGLRTAELAGVFVKEPPALEDPDFEQWIYELRRYIGDANASRRDLITLYL